MVPLFPLPNVVLFPNVCLPLHIFEDRYREMVRDALAGDRIIAMVLLRQGHQLATTADLPSHDLPGAVPPVHDVGCTGLITHVAPLRDGRYNIVLRGLERCRILAENHERPYRRATIERVPDLPGASEDALSQERRRLEHLLERSMLTAPKGTSRLPRDMASTDLINTLAQYLEFDPLERQALLERDCLVDRCRSMIDLLEMKSLADGRDFGHCGVQ